METYQSTLYNLVTKSQSGQSIVQVLVAAFIMGIVLFSSMSMLRLQTRETRALEEKLGVIDIQQQLSRSFSDGSLCSTILTPPFSGSTAVTFTVPTGGATPTNPVSQNLNLTYIPISVTSQTSPLVSANKAVSINSSTLIAADAPNTFQLTNIIGSSNGTTGTFTANIQINFDQSKLVRPLKPASTPITLLTTGGITGPQTITSCLGVDGTGFPPTILSNPGTFTITVPTGATRALVEIWAGGGGGGGVGSINNGSASGGGGGGYAYKFISGLSAGQTISATVGAGGLAGGIGGSGGTGEDTIFGTYFSVKGGNGGSANGIGLSGTGGDALGGDLNIVGGDGCTGSILGLNSTGGAGGGSPRGGQGGAGAIGIASSGVQPGGGGGGSGSSTINPGAPGAPGMIIVNWR